MLGTPKAISTKKQRIPWMRENGQGDKFIDEQWTISRKPNGISRVGSSETTREKLVLVALTIERLLIVERQWQIERSTTKMTDKYLLIIIEWYWFSESSRRAVLGGLGAKLIEGGGYFCWDIRAIRLAIERLIIIINYYIFIIIIYIILLNKLWDHSSLSNSTVRDCCWEKTLLVGY